MSSWASEYILFPVLYCQGRGNCLSWPRQRSEKLVYARLCSHRKGILEKPEWVLFPLWYMLGIQDICLLDAAAFERTITYVYCCMCTTKRVDDFAIFRAYISWNHIVLSNRNNATASRWAAFLWNTAYCRHICTNAIGNIVLSIMKWFLLSIMEWLSCSDGILTLRSECHRKKIKNMLMQHLPRRI